MKFRRFSFAASIISLLVVGPPWLPANAVVVRELLMWEICPTGFPLVGRHDSDMACLRALLASPDRELLTRIDLSGLDLGTEGASLLAAAEGFDSLEALSLADTGLSCVHQRPCGICDLADSELFSGLKRLDLGGNELCREFAVALAGAEGLSKLEYLNLSDSAVQYGLEALGSSPYFGNLRVLVLRRVPLGAFVDDALQTRVFDVFARTPMFRRLKALDVSHTWLACLSLPGDVPASRIEFLDLSENICPLQAISSLGMFRNVRVLALDDAFAMVPYQTDFSLSEEEGIVDPKLARYCRLDSYDESTLKEFRLLLNSKSTMGSGKLKCISINGTSGLEKGVYLSYSEEPMLFHKVYNVFFMSRLASKLKFVRSDELNTVFSQIDDAEDISDGDTPLEILNYRQFNKRRKPCSFEKIFKF